MLASTFRRLVTMDTSDFLESFLRCLEDARVPYCVVGGQAVNAYVEPLVSLDLDVVVAAAEVGRIEEQLRSRFRIESFPHSLNISQAGSDLRVQIQTDPRYAGFPERARTGNVLGREMPVAAVDDVLRGKVWAASDPTRRGSKRQKDLADIARLLERFPGLRAEVPESLLSKLL